MWTLLRDAVYSSRTFELVPSEYVGTRRQGKQSADVRRDFYLDTQEVQGPEQLSMFAHYKTVECKVEWLYWRWF